MIIFLFLLGGFGYCVIELIWRGHTHPTMALLGGVCLVFIVLINNRFFMRPKAFRALLCTLFITLVEFISGVLINIVFKLNVWDYSKMPLNILGQICPLYSILWFFLSYFIIIILDKIKSKTTQRTILKP